mmetsp:Transcript_1026/g.2920  ORF Transcript_1026/g.2920 Transcript_1026/m.2920 type:complete len:356 (+) Transcript_1026:67-1134(+)
MAPMKRPAGVLQRPAADEAPPGKRPAAELMKRPAAAAEPSAEPAAELMKRPAAAAGPAAGPMKRPAAAAGPEPEDDEGGEVQEGDEGAGDAPRQDDGQDGEDGAAAGGAPKGKNEAAEARAAAREVGKKRSFITKLLAERDALAAKMKSNKDAMKRAEQELEDLQTVAKRKAISAGRIKSAQKRKLLEKKVAREKVKQERVGHRLKRAKKTQDAVRAALALLQSKAEDANMAYKRVQKNYDEVLKRIAELKAKGEEVPDVMEKDLSAAGAWKSPGLRAAKDRDSLKAALKRAREVWEKAAAAAGAKEERFKAFKEKIAEAKQRKQAADEFIQGVEAGGRGGATAQVPARKRPAGQ